MNETKMNETIYPISSIVKYIKSTLDQNPYLNGIRIQGEISNLKKHRSGHWYFTLKDDQARLSCVMFATYAARCHAMINDGTKVIVKGSISMYEAQGSVQCYVTAIREDGLGDLYVRFEEQKKKLFAQGWFDDAHKQPIPTYASDIAVISAKEGAALQDVISTIQKRWPMTKLTLYPAYVQGATASSSLIAALRRADQNGHDCLLLVRGGGSIEDLWGFNSEALVHCIYELSTPIISGVGHESDTTLVDYVCDLRAPTPTAAAQRATADRADVLRQLQADRQLLSSLIRRRLQQGKQQLSLRAQSRYLCDPMAYIKDQQMHLAIAMTQMERYGESILKNRTQIEHQRELLLTAMQRRLHSAFEENKRQNERLRTLPQTFVRRQKDTLREKISLLDAYSPLAILQRGYTLVEQDDALVKSARQLAPGDQVRIRFHDGRWNARLIEKEEPHGEEGNI